MRKEKSIVDEIYDYFKDNKGVEVSLDEFVEGFDFKYNTITATVARLCREGHIIKIRKGVYKFKEGN